MSSGELDPIVFCRIRDGVKDVDDMVGVAWPRPHSAAVHKSKVLSSTVQIKAHFLPYMMLEPP